MPLNLAGLQAGGPRSPGGGAVSAKAEVEPRKESTMFVILALLLGVAWILGLTVMKVSGFAIHVLLVLAVISVVLHFIRGRSSAP